MREMNPHINYIHMYCTAQHSEICIVVNVRMTSHTVVVGGNIFVYSPAVFRNALGVNCCHHVLH